MFYVEQYIVMFRSEEMGSDQRGYKGDFQSTW